jgi:hypothetical protein
MTAEEIRTYRGDRPRWKFDFGQIATILKSSVGWLILTVVSATAAVVIASYTGTLPAYLRDPGIWSEMLLGAAGVCFLIWIWFSTSGFWRRASVLRQAGVIVVGSVSAMVTILLASLLILDPGARLIVMHVAFLACVIILPPSLFFVFLAMRRQSLLNAHIANLYRLGLLNRRYAGPLQNEETELARRCRVGSYFERFAALYGTLPADDVRHFIEATGPNTARADQQDSFPILSAGRNASFELRTVLPVVASVLPVSIGWLVVLPPGGLPELAPVHWSLAFGEPHRAAVAFAFLGAYFFSLQMLVRRFITRDLGPNAYTAMSERILLATIGVWIIQQVIPADTSHFYVIAFVIGAFPLVVWQVVSQVAKKATGFLLRIPSLQTGRPVGELSGLTVWHEVRLEEEDVENVEAMATVDIIELLLSTRFPPHRIIDWVDEAILRINLQRVGRIKGKSNSEKSLAEILSVINIRTASALVLAYTMTLKSAHTDDGVLPAELMKDVRPLITEILLMSNFRLVAQWKGLSLKTLEEALGLPASDVDLTIANAMC